MLFETPHAVGMKPIVRASRVVDLAPEVFDHMSISSARRGRTQAKESSQGQAAEADADVLEVRALTSKQAGGSRRHSPSGEDASGAFDSRRTDGRLRRRHPLAIGPPWRSTTSPRLD